MSFAIIFDAIFIVFSYFLFSSSCLAIFANAVWAGEIGDVVAIFRVIHVSYQQTQIAPAIRKYLQREYTK